MGPPRETQAAAWGGVNRQHKVDTLKDSALCNAKNSKTRIIWSAIIKVKKRFSRERKCRPVNYYFS